MLSVFIELTESSLASSPSKFCDLVCKRRSAVAIPEVVLFNNLSSTNEHETVDIFASHFSSIYSSAHCMSVITDMESFNISFFNLPNNDYFFVDDVLFKLFNLRGVASVGRFSLSA